ncbi:hypothetical protein LXL04_026534 [Taraxacum kok-saghyz]
MADRLGFLRLRSGRMVWVFQALTSTFGKEVPVLSISPESSVTATPKSFHSPTHPCDISDPEETLTKLGDLQNAQKRHRCSDPEFPQFYSMYPCLEVAHDPPFHEDLPRLEAPNF